MTNFLYMCSARMFHNRSIDNDNDNDNSEVLLGAIIYRPNVPHWCKEKVKIYYFLNIDIALNMIFLPCLIWSELVGEVKDLPMIKKKWLVLTHSEDIPATYEANQVIKCKSIFNLGNTKINYKRIIRLGLVMHMKLLR